MPAPHEVVAAPLEVYLATVGTAFPDVWEPQASFPSGWTLLGTEGNRNYNDDGVVVNHGEEVFDFTPAGSTMPSKRFRTAETFMLSLSLVDVSAAQYALVMNDADVTDGGRYKEFSLYRGDQVNSFAVFARGMSGEDNAYYMSYEFSKAFVSVNGDVTYNKGEVAALPVEILAVKHEDSDVIRVRIQDVT